MLLCGYNNIIIPTYNLIKHLMNYIFTFCKK